MIHIVADTTSTISPKEAADLGISYIPQIIIIDDKAYRDDTEITTKEFLEKLKHSQALPKTAAPPPILYHPIYEQYSKQNDTIIVICPSQKVSGTYRSAADAALEFPDADIRIVDTQTIGTGLGTLVKKALGWAKEGKSPDFIVNEIVELGKKMRIYFYVDTLEYLHKGGRIGTATALVGSLLQVKPILLFKDGQVNPFDKQRTKKKALIRIVELIKAECPPSSESHLSILEADAIKDAQALKRDFEDALNINSIQITDLPPAIIVHVGPGVVAASFFLP
jgi:DegV family protein with EDD domain